MKIAITAVQDNLESQIDARFGRAQWLLIVDSKTNEFTAHNNSVNLNAAQGAGIQTAQNIANLNAEAVITGNLGPNAFRTLNAAGVKAFIAQNKTAGQAVEDFKNNKLQQIDSANVEGHWI